MSATMLPNIPVTPIPPASQPASEQPAKALMVTAHGLTDQGCRRGNNEDQFLIATLTHTLRVRETSVDQPATQSGEPRGHLFVVADGMGGHAGGQQASALAVHTVEACIVNSLAWCARLRADGNQLLDEFQKALKIADEKVVTEARSHPELHGMGTTLTLAYVVGRELFVAHVGDSRCYLLRKGLLYRLTRDHTLVQEMVRRGILKEEEAASHNLRHVVANAVGGHDMGVDVELHKLGLDESDRLLLCSDGLTEMVPEAEIASILQSSANTQDACKLLVDRANAMGGKDNITVVVVHFGQ